MSNRYVVIPARRQSERLPSKPLALIGDRPMVVHVCERASGADVHEVWVATDDDEILAAVTDAGYSGVLTAASHVSGTDRIEEVAVEREWADDDIVINVQGDEPLLPPALIDQVAELLAQSDADIATLATPIDTDDEFADPNVVKVVTRDDGRALYFSRAPVPMERAVSSAPQAARRHIGIYAYRVSALRKLTATRPSELEQLERLEQLRALAIGMEIVVADAKVVPPAGVDTAQDLERVRGVVANSD